jgi:hypothetical protein
VHAMTMHEPAAYDSIVNLSAHPSFSCIKSSCTASCYTSNIFHTFSTVFVPLPRQISGAFSLALRIRNECATGRFPTLIYSRHLSSVGFNLAGIEGTSSSFISSVAGDLNCRLSLYLNAAISAVCFASRLDCAADFTNASHQPIY